MNKLRTIRSIGQAAATLGLSMLIIGCGPKTGPDDAAADKGQGFIRFVNVAGETLITNDGRSNARPELQNGEISLRRTAKVGPITLKILRDKNELVSETVQVQPDTVHTFYVYKGPKGIDHKVFTGDPQRGDKTNITIRVVNLVDGKKASVSMDTDAVPLIDNVAGLSTSADSSIPPGKHVVNAKLDGKPLASKPLNPAAGEAYSFVICEGAKGGYQLMIVRNSANMHISMGKPQ